MSASSLFTTSDRPARALLGLAAGLGAALGLSACATTPPPTVVVALPKPAEPAYEATPYGYYLAGQAALAGGSSRQAADFFIDAGRLDAEPVIQQKAFAAAVMSGEIDKAAELAPAASTGNAQIRRLAALVRAVDALSDGRGKAADAFLTADPGGFAYTNGFTLLKPWTAAAAGRMTRAATLPDTSGQMLTRLAATLSQALIYERLRRYDDADADYKVLTANADLGQLYAPQYGAFLERRGRSKEAQALYKRFLDHTPEDKALARGLARVTAHKPAPPLPSVREGASEALATAAELALISKAIAEGDVYLQLALKLDPQRADAWLLVGDLRSAGGSYDAARDAYAKAMISPDSAIEARERIIATYQAVGDHDAALKLSRELAAAAPDDRDAKLILASALADSEKYDEAITLLSSIINADPSSAGWELYFQRGEAYNRVDRWPEAERDLVKALSLKPEEPDVLNYLGYSWVDRGEHLDRAMGMLQQALASAPQSGEVADSVGWAYYHLGDYAKAVQYLERAVSLNDVTAEIDDHLGDAYWRVGRTVEAQFQWRRVLTLNPSMALKATVDKKLASGLGPAPLPPARPQSVAAL